MCHSPWGQRESNTTEHLSTENQKGSNYIHQFMYEQTEAKRDYINSGRWKVSMQSSHILKSGPFVLILVIFSPVCSYAFVKCNPLNSIKRQKDRTLKDELPRWEGAQYATGDQWRNNSRKNKEMEPKQKQLPVVDVTGDGSQI